MGTHALGAKSVATDHLNEFTEEHNIAVAAHDKAVAKKEDADFNAMSKEERIDNERADFEKVIQLLGTLGEKEGGAEEASPPLTARCPCWAGGNELEHSRISYIV